LASSAQLFDLSKVAAVPIPEEIKVRRKRFYNFESAETNK
jgi:hypothetical protein